MGHQSKVQVDRMRKHPAPVLFDLSGSAGSSLGDRKGRDPRVDCRRPVVPDGETADGQRGEVEKGRGLASRRGAPQRLVKPEHAVRAIWELVGQRDLAGFYAPIRAVEGVAGREAIDPRLLISL